MSVIVFVVTLGLCTIAINVFQARGEITGGQFAFLFLLIFPALTFYVSFWLGQLNARDGARIIHKKPRKVKLPKAKIHRRTR